MQKMFFEDESADVMWCKFKIDEQVSSHYIVTLE